MIAFVLQKTKKYFVEITSSGVICIGLLKDKSFMGTKFIFEARSLLVMTLMIFKLFLRKRMMLIRNLLLQIIPPITKNDTMFCSNIKLMVVMTCPFKYLFATFL